MPLWTATITSMAPLISTLEGGGSVMLPALYTLPIYDFDLRATHARTLLPAALASVSFGFVLVRVRVGSIGHSGMCMCA